MFDAEAVAREVAQAGEKFEERSGARRAIEGPGVRPHAQLRDLAGAAADEQMQRRLVIDQQGFEMKARLEGAAEDVEAVLAERLFHHAGKALLKDLHALTHGIVREEPAQDDPEQLHARQYQAGHHPGWFAGGTSHKLKRQRVEITLDRFSLSDGVANA